MSDAGRGHDVARTPLDDLPEGARLLDRVLAHMATERKLCACDDCTVIWSALDQRYHIRVVPGAVDQDLWLIPRDATDSTCYFVRSV